MDRTVCEHFNLINNCKECEENLYKVKVIFEIQTKLGYWVEDSVYHVDYKRAENWVRRMGNRIRNSTIIN